MNRHVIVGKLVGVFVCGMIVLAGCTTSDSGTSGTTPSGGAADGGAAASGETAVTIKDAAFDPQTVEISVGGAVTWTNEDSVPHTVTGDGGMDSGSLAQGEGYTATFNTAGTFDYGCTIHPLMSGTVVVK